MDQPQYGMTMSKNGNPSKIHILKGSGLTIKCKTIEEYRICSIDELSFNTNWCKLCFKIYNGERKVLNKIPDTVIKEPTQICKYCNLPINETSFFINQNYFFHSNYVKPCFRQYEESNKPHFDFTKNALIFKYPYSNYLTCVQWYNTIRNNPNHEFQSNTISSLCDSDESMSDIDCDENKQTKEHSTFDIAQFFI
jgi:hypothetical protein